MPERIAVVRTSDRGTFKRCRRKWAWGSPLRQNRGARDQPSYFWIGTGGHFALEDYHGYNHFQHPVEAFRAYVAACKKQQRKEKHGLPDDWEEQSDMCEGILNNYLLWSKNREQYQTVWLDGIPQVEITCHIPLPVKPPPGFDSIVYQFTLDRLVEIEDEYWIVDWKFYKQFHQGSLDFDPQLTAYTWAAQTVFPKPIAGAILHEFKKKLPNAPRVLQSGKISTALEQGTSHGLYREALLQLYGEINRVPDQNIRCLNDLAARESPDRDDFIKRARTRRTELQLRAEGSKILLELEDMCNPDLPLYPNFTRDCSWDCSFQDACLMMDRDDDWEYHLNDISIQRTEEMGGWRHYLS